MISKEIAKGFLSLQGDAICILLKDTRDVQDSHGTRQRLFNKCSLPTKKQVYHLGKKMHVHI